MERPIRPVDWELIERYLAGDLRGEERTRAESSLREHPRLREMLAVVEQRLGRADGVAPRDVEQAYAILATRLRLEGGAGGVDAEWRTWETRRDVASRTNDHADDRVASDTPARPARVPRGRNSVTTMPRLHRSLDGTTTSAVSRRRVARWIVSGVGLAATVVLGTLALQRITRPLTATKRTFTTTIGRRATVTLPDGSRVTLFPQSTLTMADGFGDGSRHVSLIGEAYFTVTLSARAPFIVNTGAITTRVLGTAFDVQYMPADSAVRIAVVTGRVATGGRRTPVILTAGTVGYITDTSATTTVVSDLTPYTDWTTGRLVFDDVPASVMLATVGRWYGYTFRLADSSLADRHVNAMFNITAREKTLHLITALLDVTMDFNGATVTLSPRDPHHRTTPTPVRWDHRRIYFNEVGK